MRTATELESHRASNQPTVSIIIVDFRTPIQTKLCLRSLRRYTNYPCDFILVENDRNDESAKYVRGLSWVRYFENKHPKPDHLNGLDLGISQSKSDFILIMHTDTFVRRHGWLQKLLSHMGPETMIVGSPDRVIQPLHPLLWFDDFRKEIILRRRWRKRGKSPKIISHCVLYRESIFTNHSQKFVHPYQVNGQFHDCGEPIQRYCEESGKEIILCNRKELAPYLWHFEGATLNRVLNRKLPMKRRFRSWSFYHRREVKEILADSSLDR